MSFKLKLDFKFIKFKHLLLFILLEFLTCNGFIWAQAKPEQSSDAAAETRQNSSERRSLKLPPRGSPIGRRRGGTNRNNCPALDLPPTALVPGKETFTRLAQSKSFLASTVSEHPTFWLYIPQLPERMKTGEFILQTETGEDLERTQIKLPSTAGTIAISLPPDSPYSLTVGKKYQWYFKIYCDESISDSDYVFVDAWIERVSFSSELKQQLQMTNKKDYTIYGDRYIWYNALTSLGKRLQTSPNDRKFKTDWYYLLESVDLSHLSDVPIIKIYQL